ncbi:MAG: glycosyltransferase family 4 protein [Myxococcota bacterium]
MNGGAMRVALIIERFEPAGGGLEADAWKVAHGLAEAGDEVHVVARRAVESRAVTLHPVDVRSRWQPLRVSQFARGAARVAPRADFDVVHAFSRTLDQDLYRAGEGSHADYMMRVYPAWSRRLRRWTPRHARLLDIERRIFEDDSQVIQCISELVRDEIARRFGVPERRLVTIYNGVDAGHFHPGEAAPRDGSPVWLFAGSGWRRKGLDTALAALATGPKQARLQVAGRDAVPAWKRRAAQLGVADRVSFLGPQSDMATLYRQVDGLLLPTRYDAFANVCLEAAASGLAVVTSGAAGCADLLRDAGVVVDDPEDIAGFAAALERLEDSELRAELGQRARAIAELHTWASHIEQLRDLYRKLRG